MYVQPILPYHSTYDLCCNPTQGPKCGSKSWRSTSDCCTCSLVVYPFEASFTGCSRDVAVAAGLMAIHVTTGSPRDWRHGGWLARGQGQCQLQFDDLPRQSSQHRRWNRGPPPGLKVDPLLNASPSLGSIHLINSAPR